MYRQQLTHEWAAELLSRHVPASQGTSLIKTLADPVKVSSAWLY